MRPVVLLVLFVDDPVPLLLVPMVKADGASKALLGLLVGVEETKSMAGAGDEVEEEDLPLLLIRPPSSVLISRVSPLSGGAVSLWGK